MYKTILNWLKSNYLVVYKAITGLLVSGYVLFGVITCKQNLKLTEELSIARNNIEAYLGSLAGSLLANNVLRLDMKEMANLNDKLVRQLDSIAKKNDIKVKDIDVAATQKQTIDVSKSKGVRGSDIIKYIEKDTTYSDSINYNEHTIVYYTVSKDSVNVALKVNNTQYLYVFKKKEYIHKKSFLKRLFTLDFKKEYRYKYRIYNSNDLIQEDSVRVVERIIK